MCVVVFAPLSLSTGLPQLSNENCINYENRILNSGSSCNHSIQSILFSRPMYKCYESSVQNSSFILVRNLVLHVKGGT
jgi:hypothetical protein